MNYEEAVGFIREHKGSGISLCLSRMRNLCGRLGDPEKKLRFIHIAGTNGKGSVAAYISSILGVNGYYVGRYVSPVVFEYEECIQFEDSRGITYISRELLAELITEVADAVSEMERDGQEIPTGFEIETAVALLAFVKKQCQIVVLEVGLGGREDATNVIENVLASVITPVSRDHMGLLGDTIEEIAAEKAGIIRENVPVISLQELPEAEHVIARVCSEKKAPLTIVKKEEMHPVRMDLHGSVFSFKGENYSTHMTGSYQIRNACLAIEVCHQLEDFLSFDEEQVMLGVREAYWRGRFEVVSTRPLIIVDGAHNESGAKALRESLETFFPGQKIHGVMGVFRDKEYDKMVSVMQPLMQDIVTVTAPTERGLPAEELRMAWENSGISLTETAESVNEGLKKAIARCEEGGLIVLFGSLSLLGELNWR